MEVILEWQIADSDCIARVHVVKIVPLSLAKMQCACRNLHRIYCIARVHIFLQVITPLYFFLLINCFLENIQSAHSVGNLSSFPPYMLPLA